MDTQTLVTAEHEICAAVQPSQFTRLQAGLFTNVGGTVPGNMHCGVIPAVTEQRKPFGHMKEQQAASLQTGHVPTTPTVPVPPPTTGRAGRGFQNPTGKK